MRMASALSGSRPVRISAYTNHSACAKKHSNNIPARNCGRPKRSRVKNGRIRSSRVFYHGGGSFRKPSAMSDLEINRRSSLQPTSAPDSTSPNFGMATEPSYTATLVFGPEGLRPGWGLLFYIVVFYALQKATIPWAWARDFGAAGLWSMLLEELCSLAAAVIPALILSRVEHHPWKTYGLPSKLAFGRLFWTGALWGFSGI